MNQLVTKRKAIFWGLLFAWVCLCIFTLFNYWFHEAAWSDGEIHTLYFLKMSALTFPLGVFLVMAGNQVLNVFASLGLDLAGNVDQKLSVLLIWFVTTLAGLFQWFYLIPLLLKRMRRNRTNRH